MKLKEGKKSQKKHSVLDEEIASDSDVEEQECMMTSFFIAEEEEKRVTSYSGRGESRISRVYYK